jgi:hypothetical protein
MTFFRILLGIDILIAAVALYFFAAGVSDGTISSFNIYLWLKILACVASVPIGGIVLKAYGRNHLANLVLMILALPGVGYVLFFAVLIISHPRWN